MTRIRPLPKKWAKCRQCGGALRCRIDGADRWIICDACEYMSLAPAPFRQLIDDIIGEETCRS